MTDELKSCKHDDGYCLLLGGVCNLKDGLENNCLYYEEIVNENTS